MQFYSALMCIGIIHLVRGQDFPKNCVSDPLIRMYVSWSNNLSFSENFAYVLDE